MGWIRVFVFVFVLNIAIRDSLMIIRELEFDLDIT